jgi:hypothetical protein
MISYWIDLGFYFVDSEASWRAPVAVRAIFFEFPSFKTDFPFSDPNYLRLVHYCICASHARVATMADQG